MSKSEHARFSFSGKSNAGLLTTKIKQAEIENTSDGKHERKKKSGAKKEKKNWFWRTWNRFLKRRRSAYEAPQIDTKMILERTLEMRADGDSPGEKVYRILTGATESVAEATAAPKSNLFPGSGSSGEPPTDVSDLLPQTEVLEGEHHLNLEGTRLNKNGNERKTEKATEVDALRTSALFIRENVDKTHESTDLLKANFPGNTFDSRSREESSRGVNILKGKSKQGEQGREKEKGSGEIVPAFKTVSEPAWNERVTILQKRRLRDKINNLLEQCSMFLEAEDIIDFSVSRHKLTKCQQKIRFKRKSRQGPRELSREVSPQILVNIKPFKEYVSENYLAARTISRDSQRNVTKMKPELGKLKKWISSRGKEENRDLNCCQVFKSRVAHSEEVPRRITETPESGTRRRKLESSGGGNQEKLSFQLDYEFLPNRPLCTVWGVYKSYTMCGDAIEEAEITKVCTKEIREAEKVEKTSPSVEEVLNNLEDPDHDLIFQRNIAQFRRKINVMPRFDLNNSVLGGSKLYPRKLSRSDHSRIKRAETCRLERLLPWKFHNKSHGVLGTAFLVFSTGSSVVWILGSRVEGCARECRGVAREVHEKVESGTRTEVTKEYSGSGEIRLFLGEGWKREDRGTSPSREVGGAPAWLSVQGRNFNGRVCAGVNFFGKPKRSASDSLTFFPTPTECFYILPEYWFSGFQFDAKLSANPADLDEPSLENLSLGCVGSRKSLITPEDTESEVFDGAREERKERSNESACRAIEILTRSSWDHTSLISENPSAMPRTPKWQGVKKEETLERFEGIISEGVDPRFEPQLLLDGFRIIYNNSKESLNDEEETPEKSIFSGSLTERNHSFLLFREESENKVGMESAFACSEGKEASGTERGRTLRHKSNSSPKENLAQREFFPKELRPRRSFVFPSEMEKDLQSFKKRRLSFDKGVEARRTGSGSADARVPKPGAERPFGKEEAFMDFVFSDELKTTLEQEAKSADKKKMLVYENSKVEAKKEIVAAAFNSAKELNAGKGENRRMSLVIMISRK